MAGLAPGLRGGAVGPAGAAPGSDGGAPDPAGRAPDPDGPDAKLARAPHERNIGVRRLDRMSPEDTVHVCDPAPDTAEAASDREVDVWRLDCARHGDAARVFESALDAAERDRSRLMQRDDARLRFTAGRWLVRHVLARRLGCTEAEVVLAIGAHGRPMPAAGGIDFNLSHAGSLVVLALSAARTGIDVEATKRANDWRAIARRFFSMGECAAIEAYPEAEQRAAFFRVWVRKEAFVKALGTGIATGLGRFDVSAGPEPALTGARIDGIDPAEWSIRDFAPGPGYAGAVAVRAARPRVKVCDAEP